MNDIQRSIDIPAWALLAAFAFVLLLAEVG